MLALIAKRPAKSVTTPVPAFDASSMVLVRNVSIPSAKNGKKGLSAVPTRSAMEEVRFLRLPPLHSHTSEGRRAARALDSLSPIHQPIPPATPPSIPGPYLPFPLTVGYYGQPTPHIPKPGESAQAYPYYVAQVIPDDPAQVNHPGENPDFHSQQGYYPLFHAPFQTQAVYPHSQGFITVRHNLQVHLYPLSCSTPFTHHNISSAPRQDEVNSSHSRGATRIAIQIINHNLPVLLAFAVKTIAPFLLFLILRLIFCFFIPALL